MNHERLELKPVAALSDDERAALKALSSAVYPPDVIAASPRRHLTWAPPDYGVLVRIRPGAWFHTWVSVVGGKGLDGAGNGLGVLLKISVSKRQQ
jgi:hypothetical protein